MPKTDIQQPARDSNTHSTPDGLLRAEPLGNDLTATLNDHHP